jgi:hypothetical protein
MAVTGHLEANFFFQETAVLNLPAVISEGRAQRATAAISFPVSFSFSRQSPYHICPVEFP